jgi:type II secretory pathway pseudopilin PulG
MRTMLEGIVVTVVGGVVLAAGAWAWKRWQRRTKRHKGDLLL